MIAADRPDRPAARLCAVDAAGRIRHLPRAALATVLARGDLVVANDAATLPASLHGLHAATGLPVELRLAGWVTPGDPTRFAAIAFGAGDHRIRTEDRPAPPNLAAGDHLSLGPLNAVVERGLGHPRPIQYAHVPAPLALWGVWTRIAADPVAFEPPSAGFALDWALLAAWRRRGIGFATLTHAAGISSTGDPALDRRLPFDEPYRIPEATAAAVAQAKATGRRIVAIGTTVVRALEAAAGEDGSVRAGDGVAANRIGPGTRLRVADALLTGMHQPGESHFELLSAFAPDGVLDGLPAALATEGYRGHEFGDVMLLERQAQLSKCRDGRKSVEAA